MKFIISSSELLKNLQAIYGVVTSSSSMPILEDFLFELKGQELTIVASDLETTMAVRLELENAGEDGKVTIPAKILLDTLKTFPELPLTVTVNMQTHGVELMAGDGRYKLAGHDSSEFPEIPQLANASGFEMPQASLRSAIIKTIFATGNDDLRPVMSGVLCESTPEQITFVATDAHKLVRYRRKDVQPGVDAAIILPKKPLNLLKNILDDEETVKVEFDEKNARFTFGNIVMICRLIMGKYPHYEAVIPSDNPNVLTIDRLAFITALRRVALYANASTNQIRLKLTGQELTLMAEDTDFANEARERVSCNYSGQDMEIGFNSKFLIEMLNNLSAESIRLEMSQPSRAGIIFEVDPVDENEDILMLVMPVMLNEPQ